MSKITNDGLTRSGTECFLAVPIWQQWSQRVNANAAVHSHDDYAHDDVGRMPYRENTQHSATLSVRVFAHIIPAMWLICVGMQLPY